MKTTNLYLGPRLREVILRGSYSFATSAFEARRIAMVEFIYGLARAVLSCWLIYILKEATEN